jgi:YD repeat-containing protein
LLEVDYPDGSSHRYQYDQTYHKVTAATDASNVTTDYVYDPTTGDLIEEIDAAGNETTYEWSNGELESMTDGNDQTTAYEYDEAGRLIETISPSEATHEQSYDSAGNPDSADDSAGQHSETVYSGRGLLTQTSDAYDHVTSYTVYSAAGFAVYAVDARGAVTTSTYDSRGWLMTQTVGANTNAPRTTQYTYDPAGDAIQVIDLVGNRTVTTYNLLNEQTGTQVFNPDGNLASSSTVAKEDVEEEPIEIDDGLGQPSRIYYDGEGRALETVDAQGNPTFTIYDCLRGHASGPARGRRRPR